MIFFSYSLLKIQVGVFSTTMPLETLEITRKFMSKPVRILMKRNELDTSMMTLLKFVDAEWTASVGQSIWIPIKECIK